jgi:hypothetical protein
LQASINASDTAIGGTVPVTVFNPVVALPTRKFILSSTLPR